jgi:nitroreductase/NAD-dependent dihydropyrimidine dehydrogenase PreA subunit
MGLIQINEAICKKDGFCVQECPVAILRQEDNESFPEMVPGGDGICLACGHCVAVCPHGAFSHTRVPLEECPAVVKEDVISGAQAVQFLRSRRSIRKFKSKPVEKQVILELIETARYAPTGSNVQGVEWTVFTKKEDLREISKLTVDWLRIVLESPVADSLPSYFPMIVAGWDFGMDVILRDAPALVIASAPGDFGGGMVDLSIALSYLELTAVPVGLGTCWAGLAQQALLTSDSMKDFIGLPKSHASHYPMMLGYPKFRYHRLPERKTPRVHWKD